MMGTYTPASSGMYTLEIANTRGKISETGLKNFLDTILLEPENPMLGADGQTLTTFFLTPRSFFLTAGNDHANKDYWMWMGYSGTYPGINVSGVNTPLNYDMLVEIGLIYPGFAHPDFVGVLDASGEATVTMNYKPDLSLLDLTLYFSYIVLSPGGGLPVMAASNHINCTVTLFE